MASSELRPESANERRVLARSGVTTRTATSDEVEVAPQFFGTEERALAGTLHFPTSAQRDAGVVLCNPFGIELLASRRAYRHLADRLARAGIPTLRFDYDG